MVKDQVSILLASKVLVRDRYIVIHHILQLPTIQAGEPNPYRAMCRGHFQGAPYIGRVSSSRDGDHPLPRRDEIDQLLGKYLLILLVIAPGGDEWNVISQADRF